MNNYVQLCTIMNNYVQLCTNDSIGNELLENIKLLIIECKIKCI